MDMQARLVVLQPSLWPEFRNTKRLGGSFGSTTIIEREIIFHWRLGRFPTDTKLNPKCNLCRKFSSYNDGDEGMLLKLILHNKYSYKFHPCGQYPFRMVSTVHMISEFIFPQEILQPLQKN